MPSSKLNDIVNLLADGEFADWCGLDRDGGKEFAYQKLCKWHRGRCPYDPDDEKLAFEDYDLRSLRKKALKEIERGMNELRSELPRELVKKQQAIVSHTPPELEQAMSLIGNLKAHAVHRGYFERLKRILAFEKRVVLLLCKDKRLRSELRRMKTESIQARANLALAEEIAHYHAEYFVKVKEEQQRTGIKNENLIAAYESSAFANKDVSGYPAKLACKKWIIDVYFYDIRRNFLAARKLDEIIFQHNCKVSVLNPREHCLLLSRLAIYYANLGDNENTRAIIGFFEESGPEKEGSYRIYLKRYLYSMFAIAVDANDAVFEKKALDVFERNEKRLLESEQDNDWLVILIFVMSYFLARHEGAKAKQVFDQIYRVKDQKPPLQYRIQYMISHLMILFELDEKADMKVFAKNYQEFLNLHPVFAAPALAVLAFLRGNVKHQFPIKTTNKIEAKKEAKRVAKYNSKISNLLEKLKEYEANSETSSSFWYAPFYKWVASKRLETVEDKYLPNSISHPKS